MDVRKLLKIYIKFINDGQLTILGYLYRIHVKLQQKRKKPNKFFRIILNFATYLKNGYIVFVERWRNLIIICHQNLVNVILIHNKML